MSDNSTRRWRFVRRLLFALAGIATVLLLIAVFVLDVKKWLTFPLPEERPQPGRHPAARVGDRPGIRRPDRRPCGRRPGHDHGLGREGLAGHHRGDLQSGLQGGRPERRGVCEVGSLARPQAESAGQGHHPRQSEVQGPPARWDLGDPALPPQRVGAQPRRAAHRTDGSEHDFTIDTTLAGNYNTGHEFRGLTLIELELATNHTADLASPKSPDERRAELMGLKVGEYQALSESDRRKRRRELNVAALKKGRDEKETPFFGVIGPGLDKGEREAIIEYVKSL